MKKALYPVLFVLASIVILMALTRPGETEQIQTSQVQSPQMDIPDEYKIGGFALGLQTWSYNRFSVLESIEMTARAGGKVIEFYPRQSLRPDSSEDEVFNHFSSIEVINEVKAKLGEHGILAVNYGVVGLTDEEESRKVFEFAKIMNIQAVTSEPPMEAMDRLEELVKEYNIMLAIHNHPPRANRPNYHHWDPKYILSMVDGRDPRVGASADIGHWVRSDIPPIEGLKILERRIISVHMVDVDQFGRSGQDVVNGLGVGDMSGVLEELERQNFGGNISIEYATNWYDNVTDIAQNIGYVRGWASANRK